MTSRRLEVRQLIDATIEEINEINPPDRQLGKSSETIIVGKGSALDSLAIINFLVTLEQKVMDSSGRTVNLLDDELLSGDDSPLRTLALIEEFISKRL